MKSNEESLEHIASRARNCAASGDVEKAYELYFSIVGRTSKFQNQRERTFSAEACAFVANVAINSKQIGTALDWYRKAVEIDPLTVEYRIALASKVLMALGMIAEARGEAEKAVKIAPDDPGAWRVLGNTSAAMGEFEKSIQAYDRQMALSKRATGAVLDMAEMFSDVERYDEAEKLCRELIDRGEQEHIGDVYHILAMVQSKRGNHEEAIEIYERVLALGCMDATIAHFHMSLSLLSVGRYKEGWERNAKRIDNHSYPALHVPMQRFNKPVFVGQAAPATIHVHQESGYGDNFALMRYLPLLVERGYAVRYEVDPSLFDLVKGNFPQIEVVPEAKDYPGSIGIDDFDYHLPIGELPHAFGTDLDTVPWCGPYIRPTYKILRMYKVGIAWSAGVRQGQRWLQRYGQKKSLSFDLVAPIVKMSPGSFVSLQVGPPRLENDLIADVLPESPTWAETAALMANLDLIITPDTGLAHLAGAMGKPTWLMMHCHNHGWHFMCERPGSPWNTRSPWYPSIKIFRQRIGYDSWDEVILAIKREFSAFF